MPDVMLSGCSTRPLGAYLKGLGAFRLVAEQLDPSATAAWSAEFLRMSSSATERDIEAFFVEAYRPTPIVSPWNGSSGFDDKRVPEVERIIESNADRLEPYRRTIRQARQIVEAARRDAVDKDALVKRCRARLPDEAIAWLDAAVVLTDDGPEYPPLLGTGGNLGRLELSRNYMGHLARVLSLETGRGAATVEHSRSWLRAALFDDGDPTLVQQSIAQFDPGAAGGANMATIGKAQSVVNPWDFVLIIEGALLFASAVARRLGSDSGGTAAMPFTTRPTPVGYTSNAQDEPAKGEFWAPVWQRPITLGELAHFLAEGRADWRGRQSRTGLDFARAVASLGTDRGVDRFVRHAFVERLGQMTLAVPVGVVAVRERREVRVLGQLDQWLDQIRRTRNQPAGVAAALRRVEHVMYVVATDGGPRNLQRVLRGVSELHQAVGRSPSVRERVRPLAGVAADDWLRHLDDGTDEFAVAAGLASAKDRDASLRQLLTDVTTDSRGRLVWSERPAPVPGLATRHIADVLADALQRHAVERGRNGHRRLEADALDHVGHGLDLHFGFQRAAPLASVLRLAAGLLDARRLGDLTAGLLVLSWRVGEGEEGHRPRGSTASAGMFPAVSMILPFFHGAPLRIDGRRLVLRADPAWPQRLAADRVPTVLDETQRRLRMAGVSVPAVDSRIAAQGHQGRWLAVAALCRLSARDTESLIAYVNPPQPK